MKKVITLAALFLSLVGVRAQWTFPNDAIYVAEEQKLRVSSVDSNGVVMPFANNVGLIYGLASDQGGLLYAAGTGDQTVRKVRLADGYVYPFVSVDDPACMALDTNGNLYIANDAYGEIYRATPAGVIDTFASGFGWPTGMAFATNGDLYVAEWSGGKVDRVAPDGTVAVLASGFANPGGLAIDAQGNVFVTEESTSQISKIAPDGTVSTFVTGLSQPSGLAIDSAGYFYVCNESDGSLRKISPQGLMVTYATGLDLPTDMTIRRRDNASNAPVAVPNISNAFVWPSVLQGLVRSNFAGTIYCSIATSNTTAHLALDASQSHVPDQQPLIFVWGDYDASHFTAYVAPDSSASFSDDIDVGNGPVEKVLSLRAYEGAEFDEAFLDVYAASAPDVIQLLGRITEFYPSNSVSSRLSRSLDLTIKAAVASAAHHRNKVAIGHLEKYQNLILESGRAIPAETVAGFETVAQNVINALSGDGVVMNQPPPVLNVSIEGRGVVVPNLANSVLQPGTTYTLLAKPKGKNVFAGWSGDLVSGAQKLTFVATTNLNLRATFVPKP